MRELLVVFCVAALPFWSGCPSEEERQTLGGVPSGSGADAAGGQAYVPVPEGGGLGSRPPLSETLACGQPCTAETGVVGSCQEGVAVWCEGGAVACDDCRAGGRACVQPAGAAASCLRDECEGLESGTPENGGFVMQCCPNSRWCEQGSQVICDEDGRYTNKQKCLEGLDCIDGQCVPARPLVLLLFDTSGSMTWTPGGVDPPSSVVALPGCDDPLTPTTRLGISKRAFHTLFSDPLYDHVLFALQRFPQRLDPGLAPLCPGGSYSSQDQISGHVGKWAISDTAEGAWFSNNLAEILVTPFPTRATAENRTVLRSWLDFDERSTLTGTLCSSHVECLGGMCTEPGGDGTCRLLDNPDPRAAGWTPLGQSLFYSGEYLRKYVVVDGRSCLLDADCLSPTYFCQAGTCVDPNRFCRQRSIVVFSDGEDTASLGSWLDPVVQAKRFRAGLDCNVHAHCGAGFVCASSGTCQPAGLEASGNPCSALGSTCSVEDRPFPQATSAGADRLRDGLGQAIHVVVHVVDASGGLTSDSPAMAAYGGGLLVPASLASPTTLLEGIKGVIDWKDADFCANLGQ